MDQPVTIDRREAIRRVTLLLGGIMAAPTIAGAMKIDLAALGAPDWAPAALTPEQLELVAVIADHIIPRTTTPGARDAGVHRFADAILSGYAPTEMRTRFIAGLSGVDYRARRAHGKTFVQLTKRQQLALLTQMDLEAYPAKGAIAKAERRDQPPPRDPVVGPGSGGSGALAKQTPTDIEDPDESVAKEMGSDFFWRRMKEMTLTGYYTSQAGATRELKVNPMGIWRGDIPYSSIGHAWA